MASAGHGMLIVAPSGSTAAVAMTLPASSFTEMVSVPGSRSSSNVNDTVAGGSLSTAPSAGLVDTSRECASAGAIAEVASAAAASTMARGRRMRMAISPSGSRSR